MAGIVLRVALRISSAQKNWFEVSKGKWKVEGSQPIGNFLVRLFGDKERSRRLRMTVLLGLRSTGQAGAPRHANNVNGGTRRMWRSPRDPTAGGTPGLRNEVLYPDGGVGCAEHDFGVEEGAGDTRCDRDQLALAGEDLDLSRASQLREVYR
jgi:hypothetical protein